MQDDSRQRVDTSANEHREPTRTIGFETQNAGHGYDIHASLTESNLSRHTRLNPPDARDTVQWFLRGLPPDIPPGGDREQVRWTADSRHNEYNTREKDRRAEESHDHQPVRSAQEKRDGQRTQTIGRHQSAPSVPLVEQRRSLVTSIKSKHESSTQQLQKKKPASIVASSKSSTFEVLRPRLLDQRTANDDKPQRKVTVLAEESQKTVQPKAREKRKHSEADSTDKHKAKSSRKAVRSSHDEVKDVIRKEKQKERALRSLAAEEVNSDRQQVLEQRRERRRAKAVIVKDRAKVTGPSEVVVKSNKKAPKVTADEPSKYRESRKREQAEGQSKQAVNIKPSSRRKKARSDTSIEGSDPELKVDAPKRKKRSTDVQRSMRALKDAAKGRPENANRRRYDPLERATNILPAGRVTLKAKTGIYNHGQASRKHSTGADPPPKRLTDLAFSELPFLNPPIGESSKSRLLQKQDTSAYRIVATEEKGDRPPEVRFTDKHSRSTCSTRSSTASDTSGSLLNLGRADIRPKSPKLINASKHNAERGHGRESFRSPAKTDNAEVAMQKPRTIHCPQGLSLESREAESSVTTPTRNLTGESFCESSRKLSTVINGGQLSSLTGLSAGSLVRRRLLRRLDKAGTVVNHRMNEDDLGAELRAFRTSRNLVQQQSHGPSAKYGTAVIGRGTTSARAGPDLPQPQAPSGDRAIPLEPLQASTTHYGAQGRSPDWFASHETPGNGNSPYERHFRRLLTTSGSGVGLHPDTRRWDNEGSHRAHYSPHHEGQYQDTARVVSLHDAGAAYYLDGPCTIQAPMVPLSRSPQQVNQHAQCNCALCPACQTLALGLENHEILPRVQTFPQYQRQHPVAYAPAAGPQNDCILNYVPDSDLPDEEQWYDSVAETPGIDNPARYQQGKILRYLSPGPSTRLQGFWQRNYL